MRTNFLKFGLLTLSLLTASQRAAHADAATEAALRAALQNSTTQIAQLEDEVANLQASQAPNVAMIEALRTQLKAQGGGKSPAATAKNDAALKAAEGQLAAVKNKLGSTQSDDAAATAQVAALKAHLARTQAGLSSCDAQNAQLYQLGNQILDAYSHKDGVFSAFADHEPFTGFARVKLQNIVQDDQDKLDSEQINPAGTSP
jgi:chromosome segregation ATPase